MNIPNYDIYGDVKIIIWVRILIFYITKIIVTIVHLLWG